MVSLERKFDVLHHSIAGFKKWLDSCSQQLGVLSSVQAGMEQGPGAAEDDSKLKELGLQYKDLLLKMKEQCGTLQEVTSLCKEIEKEIKDKRHRARHGKAVETITSLGQLFSANCSIAKQQYSKLSPLLQASSEARGSPIVGGSLAFRGSPGPGGLRHLPRATSETPTLTYRVTQTPPPATPPRPNSAQAHRRVLSGSHYQPVFVKPTTFSLVDREEEEENEGQKGLNHRARSYDNHLNESNVRQKPPVSPKHTTTTNQSRPRDTKTVESGPKDAKTVQNGTKSQNTTPVKTAPKEPHETKGGKSVPKETKPRDAKTTSRPPKETKTTKESKAAGKKSQKKRSESESQEIIPEILSLDGSPVIAGRRMFAMPSSESLDRILDTDGPNLGQSPPQRGSPELPSFGNGSPDRRMGHAQDTRVRVLPTLKSPQHENKINSRPPIVKPKPNVPKKPQFLKQDTSVAEKKADPLPSTTTTTNRQSLTSSLSPTEVMEKEKEKEEEKAKTKKSSRFSKLYTFVSVPGSPKKSKKDASSDKKKKGEVGGGGGTVEMDAADKNMGVAEWEGPVDGRESPLLQGRRGVKVMLKDDNMEVPVLSPRKTADSAKWKAPPPPVARKPVGLMERITTEKKSDQSAGKARTKNSQIASGVPKAMPTATPTDSTHQKSTPSSSTKATPTITSSSDPGSAEGSKISTRYDVEPTADETTTRQAGQPQPPQQLKIRKFKLDNLASDSVSSARELLVTSSGKNSGSRSRAIDSPRERDRLYRPPDKRVCPPEANTSCRGLAVVSGVDRLLGNLDSVAVGGGERGERGPGTGKTDNARGSSVLDPVSDHDSSDTDTEMERVPGYDRLGLRHNNNNNTSRTIGNSIKYDHLSRKQQQTVGVKVLTDGGINQKPETLEIESGRGFRVEEEDKGQSYYIGGGGRKRDSEIPRTPLYNLQDSPLDDGSTSLRGRLRYLATQLHGHVQVIAERERCSLRSLQLEIHRGEVKAMLTLLEVQDFELVHLRAKFSPPSKSDFGSLVNPPAPRWPEFPCEEVELNREEIVKLSERMQLLQKHCVDSITQAEEVTEYVHQFENELKVLTEFLNKVKEKLQLSRETGTSDLDRAWDLLAEVLAGVNSQRTQLSSIEQLSNHLLYLEPVFDGDCIRGDMQQLSSEYQGAILEVFSQLEALAHVKSEQLLLDMSVVAAWVTEAGLGLQALTKRSRQSVGVGDRIAASKESLDDGLKKHKNTLRSVTKELEKLTLLLSPGDHNSLRELVHQVGMATKSLAQIEEGLEMMEFAGGVSGLKTGKTSRVKGNGAKSSDSDYAELEDSLKILERKQSRVLPPVPVRNVNGAKANVKTSSDYTHIEDINIHGHTPKMNRKKMLKPYAQISVKDVPEEDDEPPPPPLPRRPGEIDGVGVGGGGYLELKEGQSIRDLPLPPRPDEIPGGFHHSSSTSPHLPPAPISSGNCQQSTIYDTLPSQQDKATGPPASPSRRRDSWLLYDVPRSILHSNGGGGGVPSYGTYDTPRSVLRDSHLSLPRQQSGGSGDQLPRQQSEPEGPHELYDVPRSLLEHSRDVYDVPRTLTRNHVGQTGKTTNRETDHVTDHVTSSPDDSVFSPPLYDVPRSLLLATEGPNPPPPPSSSLRPNSSDMEPGQDSSGQSESGQKDGSGQASSGQAGSGQGDEKPSTEAIYDAPKSFLEPPSPLVEFNEVATRHLERAIRRLPQSAVPYRPELEAMGVEFRGGKGAGLRPSSLHEELLQFIIDEWAQIPKESSPPPSEGSRLVVEETAGLLGNRELTNACMEFAGEVGDLEEQIRGVTRRISNLRVPREPDLEKVHNGIDQCESLMTRLKKLQISLNSCNETSLTLLSSLCSSSSSQSPPPPLSSSSSPPPPPPSARMTQLIEIWLFDLTTIIQSANLQLSTKLRELREKETLTNSLHRHLQTLSHTLSAAETLVKERDDVIEVRGHLQQCKDMHKQLTNQSNWVDQLVDEMEKYVSSNPQSQACQNLLDQAKQIRKGWETVCDELAAVPKLEPTLRVNMINNVAVAIGSMENDLPGLEFTTFDLNDVIGKQRKARSLVSRCRQLLSSLQTTEVNLLQTMAPPAGNHGNHVVKDSQSPVGGVDPAQQQKRCHELQQHCKRIMSELKTLSSLLATSHTLLEQLEKETEDLRVWLEDTRVVMEIGEVVPSQQHRMKFQAISQQVLAKQPQIEAYQTLISEVLLLPGKEEERKKIEKQTLAIYSDWDAICQQCIPAGALPFMSPTTPQDTLFQAPQEFEDPLQMVEWLIMLDFKLQPEKMVVGDFLHVQRALRDLQLIENELKSKEKIYNHFMRDLEKQQQQNNNAAAGGSNPETENEQSFESVRERSNSPSPAPLSLPILEDSVDFNPSQRVNLTTSEVENRRRRFKHRSGMESVQEQSGEEENGTPTTTLHPPDVDSNKSTASLGSGVSMATPINKPNNRQSSLDASTPSSSRPCHHSTVPKQPSLPLMTHSSLPHGYPTPPSSLSSLYNHTPSHSLLSSLSSLENGSQSLLSRQVSITSSVTASLAELIVAGSPGASLPEDLYQLKLLWNGIRTAVDHKRHRLELIRDAWRSCETKKEEFTGFLTKIETRLRDFPVTISQSMDLGVIQNELETQKSLLEKVPTFEHKLNVLNEVGRDLTTRFHANDCTSDLQDVLQDINQRWSVVMESVARHQPEVNLLNQQWVEFHTHYQTFNQWLRNKDTDMANLNPFVSNMATVQMQLAKLKEIQEELVAHEGVLDSIKLLSYKLQAEFGGRCHVNPTAIHSRLESASRRWDGLQKLAQERRAALEESMTDKQQLLTRMADCLSWLQQAEQHMLSQQPLGGDYYQIHNQFIAHQSFRQEVEEQTPKMEAVIQAGHSGLLDVQWPLGTPERSRMDSLRSEFVAVERRWNRVKSESEEWGRLLGALHPEMESFQMLCAECGQRLSEVELRANGMPPVANRVVMLTQQLDDLREFEAGLVVIGNVLERVINTQKNLIKLGAKISGELVELVRRFHERWGEVKKRITKRYSAIDKAMVKYDPENLGVATLPRGWIREKARNGTPYYMENKRNGTQQWQHPDLSQLYQSMELEYDQPCYPNLAYPAAIKLRTLQKKTQLHLLETRISMQTFQEDHIYNIYNSHKPITNSDIIMLCLGQYEQAEQRPAIKSEPLYVNRAVELTAAWIRDVYDITHEGSVTCQSFQIAMVCLSHGRLEEKHKCLFQLMSSNSETVTFHQLCDFLEQLVQIPQNVLQTQYCSVDALDHHAQDCFKKFADKTGQLNQTQFLTWLQTEPLPLAWLAVLHRVAASETTHHDVKCAVCRSGPPITGFRYRCQQCHNYDMCQSCFWSGGTTMGHDSTRHYMEEYCVLRPSGDDLRDFFKNLQKHMKKKKKKSSSSSSVGAGGDASSSSSSKVLQEHAPQIIGDHSLAKRAAEASGEGVKATAMSSSPATKHRHTAVSVGDRESTEHQLRRHTSPPPPLLPYQPSSSSFRPAGTGGGTVAAAGNDIDFSLVKIKEDDQNLSHTLDTLRRHHHRESVSSDFASTATTTPLRQPFEHSVTTGNHKLHPPVLEDRVRVLEDHNLRLEDYISQLKDFTTSNGGGAQVPISNSNKSTPLVKYSNNSSSAHLTPRGSPYVRPERKYHYITVATTNPAHIGGNTQNSSKQQQLQQQSASSAAAMATGSPAQSSYVPISPAHQRMVLQPPALVRNKKSRYPATTLL